MMEKNQKTPEQSDGVDRLTGWLARLARLVEIVEGWARAGDWSTRRITKTMRGTDLGTYEAPALLMQKETMRVLLEPISHAALGVAGVVDLYLMPAYDDIATLLYRDGQWHFRFAHRAGPPGEYRETERPFSKETFEEVLEEMIKHAA